MMSACEFFDCGPEPSWLVDACEGEVLAPNFGLQFSRLDEASSSAPFNRELNHSSSEAGPSDFAASMELDEVAHANEPSFAHNPRPELERFPHQGHIGVQPLRPTGGVSFRQQGSWLSTIAANVPNRVATRRHPAPAAEQFLRASKKRKFGYV